MKIRARWLLLAGVALVAVALGGEHAVENDPVVTVNVVQEAPDGTCTVRWRDPLNGSQRQEPFHCAPDRDPILKGAYDTAYEVSSGPWRGDLYTLEGQGSPVLIANEIAGFCGLSGLALMAVGAVSGIVYLARHRGEGSRLASTPAAKAARHTSHSVLLGGGGQSVLSLAIGLTGLTLSATVFTAQLPDAMGRARAFQEAIACTGPVTQTWEDCTRPVVFTVTDTEINNSGKNHTYKATLTGSTRWNGEVVFSGDEPVLERLRSGDRVTGTVWHGDVVAVAAQGRRQPTGADPGDDAAGFTILGIFMGVIGALGLLHAWSCRITSRRTRVSDQWLNPAAWLVSVLITGAFLLRAAYAPVWSAWVCGAVAAVALLCGVYQQRRSSRH